MKIIAPGLPGYTEAKEYINKIYIYYNGQMVFCSENDYYNHGVWEEILEELYKKIPVLLRKQEQWRQTQEHCQELLDSTIQPLLHKGVRNIIGSLKIEKYSENSSRINNCGSYETDHHYKVLKKGETVFHAVEEGFNKYYVNKYIPGDWENELKDFLDYCKYKERKEAEQKGLDYIKQLKKLK